MKKSVFLTLIIVLISILLLSSCVMFVNKEFENLMNSDNCNWWAEEIDLTFGYPHPQGTQINGTFNFEGVEYIIITNIELDYNYFYVWVYDGDDYGKSEIKSKGSIDFEVYKIVDENTFIFETKKSDYDIPKFVTFHRITEE